MGMVHEAIIKVAQSIPAIGKNKKNQTQGFTYRGIDDVYNVLSPLLAENGLVMLPQILECNREERTNAKGTILTFVSAKIRYRFLTTDGSSLEEELCPVVVGEGMDSGDKATNKAMSIAHKYALFQMFCIPTEEVVDPDKDSHTGIRPKGTLKDEKLPVRYDIDAIRLIMGQMTSADALVAYLKSLSIPQDHPQRPKIVSLYQERKKTLTAAGVAPQRQEPKPITEGQRKAIQAHFGGWERDARLAHLSDFLGRKLESVNDMTCDEAMQFLDAVNQEKEAANA